jgi:hypothetical protein
MARASADGTSTDYMTFAGLSVTDLDHNGNPTDCIYTGGQKIAMISPADHRIHLTGITSQSGEELEVNWAVPTSFIARTGDLGVLAAVQFEWCRRWPEPSFHRRTDRMARISERRSADEPEQHPGHLAKSMRHL